MLPTSPTPLHHLGDLQLVYSPVCVEGHAALDLPQANSLAVIVKSRWEGASCGALAGALPCGMLSVVNLSAPPKGHQPPCWTLPYPRTARKVPSALEEAGAAGGLGSGVSSGCCRPPARCHPCQSKQQGMGCVHRGVVTAPWLLPSLQEGPRVAVWWLGRSWSQHNSQCQVESAERWLSGRDSTC